MKLAVWIVAIVAVCYGVVSYNYNRRASEVRLANERIYQTAKDDESKRVIDELQEKQKELERALANTSQQTAPAPTPKPEATPDVIKLTAPDSNIQVVKASYGAESAQIDVTAATQAEVTKSNGVVTSATSLAGKDPAFGKVKTLHILYRTDATEYEIQLSEGQTANILSDSKKRLVRSLTPRLTPDGTYILMAKKSLPTESGIAGLQPGTTLKLLKENGNNLHVTDGVREFDVEKSAVTNDLNVADSVIYKHQQQQIDRIDAAQRQIQAFQLQQQDKAAQIEQPPQEEASAKETANSGSYVNPLDRGAYDQTKVWGNRTTSKKSLRESQQILNEANQKVHANNVEAAQEQVNIALLRSYRQQRDEIGRKIINAKTSAERMELSNQQQRLQQSISALQNATGNYR